jgi:phosphoglycerate kinase
MKKIKDLEDLNQKIVLLRVDLNVPIKNDKVLDNTRIKKVIPTISHLLNHKAKIIIITHVGRPKGKKIAELSLKPICQYLKDELSTGIRLITKDIKNLNKKDIFQNSDDEIALLENIRFYPEEEKDDIEFAKDLASLGDIYVNEAFSCSHRAHASVSNITKFIKSYGGLHLISEIDALNQITHNIKRPISCIIGGSKISTKINVIKNLITKFDNIVIVGAMANNIIKYMGNNIGMSLNEKNSDDLVKEIISLSSKKKCNLIYPEDVVVAENENGAPIIKELQNISSNEMILDIGPKTIKNITKVINYSSTILWNGPAGYFENSNFAKGSVEIAKKIIEKNLTNKIYSVVGGGETVSLINSLNAVNNFNFVSTAGGAFLEYLEGKELPGITALKKYV